MKKDMTFLELVELIGADEKFRNSIVESFEADPLTPQQMVVFKAMAEGQRNRDIAANLKISSKTLDIHRATIYRKLRTKNLAAAYLVYKLLIDK